MFVPKMDVAYTFKFKNKNCCTLTWFGTVNPKNNKYVFINTAYGTKTEITAQRFSFIYKNFLQKEFPYVLVNRYPEEMEHHQKEKESDRTIPLNLTQKDFDLLKAFHKLGAFEQETILIQINALAEKVKN